MATPRRFVLCLRNAGYEVSLERRKIYQVLPGRIAAQRDYVRVIDESGRTISTPRHTSRRSSCRNAFVERCSPPSNAGWS